MERTSIIFRKPFNNLSGRHSSRTQRMEKRATKTLGIVVGAELLSYNRHFRNIRILILAKNKKFI